MNMHWSKNIKKKEKFQPKIDPSTQYGTQYKVDFGILTRFQIVYFNKSTSRSILI